MEYTISSDSMTHSRGVGRRGLNTFSKLLIISFQRSPISAWIFYSKNQQQQKIIHNITKKILYAYGFSSSSRTGLQALKVYNTKWVWIKHSFLNWISYENVITKILKIFYPLCENHFISYVRLPSENSPTLCIKAKFLVMLCYTRLSQ